MFHNLLARFMRSVLRVRIVLVILMVFTIPLLIYIIFKSNVDIRYCYINSEMPEMVAYTDPSVGNTVPQLLEDVLIAELKPKPGRSIFFHETSCRQLAKPLNTHINLVELNARQACAIESAALHNPNLDVFVLFASPTYQTNQTLHHPVIKALLSYPNIFLRNLNMWTYAANTPIHEWFLDGELFKSKYVISHISDFLRFLTLYRWGGTYLDMDIIMLQTIEDIAPNFSGAESDRFIAAGVINFAPDGFGHDIAAKCLHDFQTKFDGNDWGNNGPGVITRVMQSICSTENMDLLVNDRTRCLGFNVFSREAFYAIPWVDWEAFFDETCLEDVEARTQQSYVLHFWNKHSKGKLVKVGSNAPYAKFAELNCPKAYAAAGEYF
ncbi:lactosylceramide 4-alpha-galactosyltransferase [Teleopsis dalmanni]|uniref:lactosylceramide 4-alpha-galactosyltransferase n=1 Tax=Teleopsis dalmanni TaxID=139649 RepID=UPI0018CD4624|nr:lactosylceramide 4-alpha-galactosyltransferase [Teleopsis dalmanni]